MIAFVLDRLGRDPAFAIGGEIPQLGGNAGAGDGWFVVEGDESDRTIASLRPKIAVVLNIDLDHHTEFASVEEVRRLFDEWLAQVPQVVHANALEPVDFELTLVGEQSQSEVLLHNTGEFDQTVFLRAGGPFADDRTLDASSVLAAFGD